MGQELITQREYAAMRGITRQAVYKRTAPRGGPLPVYGPNKLIDRAEADALWGATISPAQAKAGHSKHKIPDAEAAPPPAANAAAVASASLVDAIAGAGADPSTVATARLAAGNPAAQAKIAQAVIRAQAEKIQLEKLKGSLIDKRVALRQAYDFTRRMRDAWLNWPARVAPILAAEIGVDQSVLLALLDREVHDHLAKLADARIDPG